MIQKLLDLRWKSRDGGLTLPVIGGMSIDRSRTGYDRKNKNFKVKEKNFDSYLIEKTENDIRILPKSYGSHHDMTSPSMWITLWKLGISLPYWFLFPKIMDKNLWKSRHTDLSAYRN